MFIFKEKGAKSSLSTNQQKGFFFSYYLTVSTRKISDHKLELLFNIYIKM